MIREEAREEEKKKKDMDGSDATATDVTNVPREYYSSSTPTSNRTLGFPLGTALLLVVIFSLSFVFSCFYHWDRVQAFRRRLRHRSLRQDDGGGDHESDPHQGMPSSPSKPNISLQRDQQSLPAIIMPGNRIPTFIAWPCPRESLPPPLSSPPVKFALVDTHIVEAPLLPPPPPPPLLQSCSLLCSSTTPPIQLQMKNRQNTSNGTTTRLLEAKFI